MLQSAGPLKCLVLLPLLIGGTALSYAQSGAGPETNDASVDSKLALIDAQGLLVRGLTQHVHGLVRRALEATEVETA